jgi:hypothetical protein
MPRPWMRHAPQRGPARAIVRTSSGSSGTRPGATRSRRIAHTGVPAACEARFDSCERLRERLSLRDPATVGAHGPDLGTENPRVGGSIPPLGTNQFLGTWTLLGGAESLQYLRPCFDRASAYRPRLLFRSSDASSPGHPCVTFAGAHRTRAHRRVQSQVDGRWTFRGRVRVALRWTTVARVGYTGISGRFASRASRLSG